MTMRKIADLGRSAVLDLIAYAWHYGEIPADHPLLAALTVGMDDEEQQAFRSEIEQIGETERVIDELRVEMLRMTNG